MSAVDADPVARERAQAAAASVRHPLTVLLLTLTFSTGLVDAVSYLGLGHVFSANMTGNVVLLGFGIAGRYDLPVVAPIVSLMAFLAGAVLGGALSRRTAHRHRAHLGTALAAEVALLAAAALLLRTSRSWVLALAAALAVTTGARYLSDPSSAQPA